MLMEYLGRYVAHLNGPVSAGVLHRATHKDRRCLVHQETQSGDAVRNRVPTPYAALGRGRFQTCLYSTVSPWAHNTFPNTLSSVALEPGEGQAAPPQSRSRFPATVGPPLSTIP